MFPHGEQVVRQRATRVADRYNPDDVALDWENPDVLTIPNVGVALSSTADPLIDAREAVDSDYTLFMETGSDVLPDDRLVIRGIACEVVGRPFDWSNPFTGWEAGMVVQAKVREG
ncbi:MAG TPA: hypothetical protein VJL80_06480 [Aeromicrobium sp.]|nr:hypothetical protein [Aeromicrobium sp.]HKY57665.1 hypothetical protein [Aeromicrobium sp.]